MDVGPFALVLVAGGPGTRLGADLPKALVPLAGRAILAHALDSIARAIAEPATTLQIEEIVVVAPGSHLEATRTVVAGTSCQARVVAGGAERQDSVRAGLDACPRAEIVAIHDAARPFLTATTLLAVVIAATQYGAAIAAQRAVDTVKVVDEEQFVVSTPPRDRVWLAQTPQAFRRALLVAAHTASVDSRSTDDAALAEAVGASVQVVPGDPAARKITTLEDLRWAEWMLQSGQWPR